MQLYRKEMKGKRVFYIPVDPYENKVLELEQEQVVTLLTTFCTAMVMSVSGQVASHSKIARQCFKVEEAIVDLAKLNSRKVDGVIVDLGVSAWNAAMREIANHGGAPCPA